jgi:aspartyl-tRNA(Asn)/glutamyl-tRNA(Gln) amidotransferase subunit C
MVTEKDVRHIGELADIGIQDDELETFTHQFNAILEYFDVLDTAEGSGRASSDLINVMREDVVEPSLPLEDVLNNAPAKEDGFIRAPRVM